MTKRQALGQHFLKSQTVANKIVDFANITKKDIVLEIGTGKGILTHSLCKKALKVISYETDKTLFKSLEKEFEKIPNLELRNSDGFKSTEKFSIFVSNLPYSKSRKAVEWLSTKNFSQGIIMVQKEFFQKLITDSRRQRRAVSVIASHAFDIKSLMSVPKEHFSPRPTVNSVLLRITPKRTLSSSIIKTVNRLFSYRRKTLQNILKQFGIKSKSTKRLEYLSDDEIVEIAKKIIKK
jgi:16S rRNA (adenine1518-N6/adenine1519-N6)-dimethyltransferase